MNEPQPDHLKEVPMDAESYFDIRYNGDESVSVKGTATEFETAMAIDALCDLMRQQGSDLRPLFASISFDTWGPDAPKVLREIADILDNPEHPLNPVKASQILIARNSSEIH